MTELVGVACVVDSSITLFSEWSRVLAEYILPLLQRLFDGGRSLKIAFVCYASSSTQPTPILSKIHFAPYQTVIKDLRNDPSKLGVGQTGAGSGRGMAALEGLVAAVELFDVLKSSSEKPSCHIIHVAYSPPDAAEHPVWNTSPRLDNITWDTLPQEVQKRDIKYSHVLLQPPQSMAKLTTFHSAAVGSSAQQPWFPVRSNHTVRLAGYPPPKAAGVKRPHEPPPSDSTQDTKRARMTSTQSPKPTTTPQASSPPQAQPTPSPVISQATAAPAAPSRPPLPANLPPAAIQKALEHLVETEKQLKAKLAEANAHHVAGRTAEAEAIRTQLQPAMQNYRKMKLVIEQYRKQFQEAQAHQMASSQNAQNPTAAAALATEPAPSTAPPPPASGPLESQPAQGPALAKAPDAQAHKMAEHRRTPSITSAMIPPAQPNAAAGPSSQLPTVGTGPTSSKHWEGMLTWRGLEHTTHARTDMQTRVTLTSAPNQELTRPETWPMMLSLAPSKERAVPWFLLQDWLKRTGAVAFVLQPRDMAGEDKVRNEEHFRALMRLLAEKKIYALSGWQGPDGKEQRVMIFPTKGGLAGGYFAEGMPEMPPTQVCEIDLESISPPMAVILCRLPATQLEHLKKLPLDRRKQWLQMLAMQQQQMHMQKQMAAQAQGAGGGGGGQAGSGINNEMIQSFITRTG
ncbi:hypothetical protein BXZ70DRAFT_948920 [Cristinia sonorae]|uniref:Mediator of RNA polymerase II transcription subunit 25 n=1 Tax=Cristinia sonorae TaxID=1940300 RepID=A0A8K0XMH8_9AGAR|nr:hypothetical protein BXZ70DRAFT_948920 [Cristinia sonorae]